MCGRWIVLVNGWCVNCCLVVFIVLEMVGVCGVLVVVIDVRVLCYGNLMWLFLVLGLGLLWRF